MNYENLRAISDCGNSRAVEHVKGHFCVSLTQQVSLYAALFKVRILGGVAASALLGAFVASTEAPSASLTIFLLVGTALSYAGAAAWNQVLEVPFDKRMPRTKGRPLPSESFSRRYAAILGVVLAVLGIVILYFFVHPLTGWLSVAAFVSYVFIYTPLKRVSWYGTLVGTVPGAIPVVGGAVASGNATFPTTLVLFFLMMFWQLPHFYSFLWQVRDEYEMAGFQMLPYATPNGVSLMNAIIVVGAILTLVCTAFISYVSPSLGLFSGITASLGAAVLVCQSICFISNPGAETSKLLFKCTLYFIAGFTCIAGFSFV